MIKKQGFTLAEVLITIGILGVIAAYTVPTVTANVQENQLLSALKVAHSTISDKIEAEMALEDVNDVADLKMFEKRTTGDVFKEMGKFMQLARVDENHKIDSLNGTKGVLTFQTTKMRQINTKAFIILEDVAEVRKTGENVVKNIKAKGGKMYRQNADVYIDVNGYTKPNRLGYDVFRFYLAQDGRLYPNGGDDVALFLTNGEDSYTQATWRGATKTSQFACNKTTSGRACAARALDEGKMIYLRKEKDPTLKKK